MLVVDIMVSISEGWSNHDTVCHFSFQKGSSDGSARLGWVEFIRSLRRCYCLSKQLVLRQWYFPMGSLFILFIGERLVLNILCHVKSCREVHWWSIPGWKLWWRRSSDRRPGSCFLTGVLDLLGRVWESPVLGISTVGLFWVSETGITVSIRRCINVIIDIKSRRLAWLIHLGRDGKSILLSSKTMVESCPCWSGVWDLAGVIPAGVPWATGPAPHAKSSTAESSRSAESATPAESPSCVGSASPAEFCTTAGSSTPGKSWSSAESTTSRHTCRVVISC